MSEHPAAPSAKIALSGLIQMDGLWVHHATPDEQADWLGIIDQIREERAQAVMCLDVLDQES